MNRKIIDFFLFGDIKDILLNLNLVYFVFGFS